VAEKPMPVGDADSQPFWDACREQRLIAQQCDACGRWRWPPRGVCPACASWAFTWRDLPRTGHVESFVVPHRPFSPGFADEVPYVVVHVVMAGTAGRVVLVSNLVGCAWEAVSVGMRVDASFEGDGLPRFRPG
jgi:uncharacterized OB-fold protein